MSDLISRQDVPDTNVGDMISRQDAINTSLEFFVEYFGGAFDENSQKELMVRLQRLPSAQPERKKGKWIDDGDPLTFKCDKCGYLVARYNNTNFCPNCGSYNGGEQDED